jgi:hypothetical protein
MPSMPAGDDVPVEFTAAQGAQDHCAPMAPQTRNQVAFDWLDSSVL